MGEPILPEPISDQESLRQLREFLRKLENVLAELTERPDLIPGRHRESMRAAWKSVQPNFKKVKDALGPNSVTKLKDAGLMGDQLLFKLSIFNHSHDELRDQVEHAEAGRPGGFRDWWLWAKRALVGAYKQALNAADVILGSLVKAVSYVEVIKEFKEAVESGLELGVRLGVTTDPKAGKKEPED